MKTAHKIIKYLAIALAIALIVGILTGIAGIFNGSYSVVSFGGSEVKPEKIFEGKEDSVLYIEIAATKVTVREGDTLSGVTDNEYINVETKDSKLVAYERTHSATKNDDTYLDITVPKGVEFDKVVIKTGAGTFEADVISAKDFELEIGAGEVIINNLLVSVDADIETGAGKVTVNGGVINNLDAELGVGKVSIRAELLGDCDVEAGVGELELILLGGRDSYKIEAVKGIGVLKIGGEKIANGTVVGNGDCFISVEGGIGNIEIEFE